MQMFVRSMLCASLLLLVACDRAPTPVAPEVAQPATAPAPSDTAPAGATPAPAARLALSADGPHWMGYGQLRWGMTPEELQAAFQPGTLSRPAGVGTEDTCHYLIPGDPDVRLMIEEGRFVRAEFLTPASTAPGGGQVGWSAAQVRAAYPVGLEELGQKYVDGAYYLRIKAPDGSDGVLLFETDASGTVTRWRMGIAPQVDYVEGCA
jgi:hypothetical protein